MEVGILENYRGNPLPLLEGGSDGFRCLHYSGDNEQLTVHLFLLWSKSGPDACKVEHVHIAICMMADP